MAAHFGIRPRHFLLNKKPVWVVLCTTVPFGKEEGDAVVAGLPADIKALILADQKNGTEVRFANWRDPLWKGRFASEVEAYDDPQPATAGA